MRKERAGFLMFLTALTWVPSLNAADAVTAEVTYVTSTSVYVSAGREDGLAIGQRLVLKRGDEVVATVEVAELSPHRASCAIVEKLLDPALGDLTRFQPAEQPAPVGVEAGVEPTERSKRPDRRRGSIRGRVGIRYLAVVDRTDTTGDYTQPAIDLRFDGRDLGGSAWDLSVDARARRTYRDPNDGPSVDESRTRLYRFAVTRRVPDQPWSLTVGRQFSPALSAVSIFDGVAADFRRDRWTVGVLSGTQPDPHDWGQSNDVREHGVYVTMHGDRGSPKRWSLTTGLIGSYEESEINREFLYLQGRYAGNRLSAYLTQEVDYNRNWKADAGEDTLAATSTYASLSYRTGRAVTLRAGFDNRRNVRLYRDLVTPVTDFDDSFRRGAWAGTTIRIRERFRVGLDVRTNRREGEGDANVYTATFGARRIAGGRLDVTTRTTRYENDRVEGWLHSVEAGVPVGSRSHLSLIGGVREEDDLLGGTSGASLQWYGIDADFTLGQRWYLSTSLERTSGDFDEVDQLYTSLTYRF